MSATHSEPNVPLPDEEGPAKSAFEEELAQRWQYRKHGNTYYDRDGYMVSLTRVGLFVWEWEVARKGFLPFAEGVLPSRFLAHLAAKATVRDDR